MPPQDKWIDITNGEPDEWQDITPPERTWGDTFASMGLRTGPALAGSAYGFGLGGPIGAAIGGIAGGFGGSLLGQWYDEPDEPFNYTLAGVEGALNVLPIAGKMPGAGAGAKALLKYAGSSALQGGLQGAVGAFPRHLAEEDTLFEPDKWTAPSGQQVALEALGGAGFGGVIGGGLGVANVRAQNRLQRIADAGPNYEDVKPSPPVSESVPPLGMTVHDIPGTVPGPLPHSLTLKPATRELVELLKQRGYVPGGTSESGYPYMVRNDLADQYDIPSVNKMPEVFQPAVADELIPISGDEVTLNKPLLSTMNRMKKQGFEIADITENGDVKFKLTGKVIPQEDIVSEMKVTKGGYGGDQTPIINPQTGRPNIAVGGADERVLDLLGTALYTRDRPATVAKELLQNSADELKISGNKGPVRIAFNNMAYHPVTQNLVRSVTVRDFGRGMGEDDLYTIFTDVGKTGKGAESSASGGFGFAKAAPLLGGDYVKISSVIDDGEGNKIQYIFEGSPTQLKKQTEGVPLQMEYVDEDTPTGFKVETFFPDDKTLRTAEELVKQTVENSPGMTGIETFSSYSDYEVNKFIDKGKLSPTSSEQIEYPVGNPIPPAKATINTPGADIDIHFELDNMERKGADIAFLNNGLYSLSDKIGYGLHPIPHVPGKIVANVKATVEEGTEGYPFGLNREEMNREVLATVKKWIKDNITDLAYRTRTAEMQKIFDDLNPQVQGSNFVVHDSGNRYTPEELANFNNSPITQGIGDVMEVVLKELADLFQGDSLGNTVKFGFLIGDANKGGINIASPMARDEFAVLINPLGAAHHVSGPKQYAQRLVHVMMHEFTHNLARSEGGNYTWKLSQVYSKFDLERQQYAAETIQKLIDDGTGNYAPEFQKLLSEYTTARGRPDSITDVLSRERESEWIADPGPSGIAGSSGEDASRITAGLPDRIKDFFTDEDGSIRIPVAGQKPRKATATEEDLILEAFNLPRGAITGIDLSAPMRQGLPMITSRHFWKNIIPMLRSFRSEKVYQTLDAALREDEIHRPRINRRTGKIEPSFAQSAGIRLSDLGESFKGREEQVASKWLESLPVMGRGYRAGNRAYTLFLNKLRTDAFKAMIKDAETLAETAKVTGEARPGFFKQKYTPDEALMLNPRRNLVLAKEIADAVNTLTGRGPLKMQAPTLRRTAEGNLRPGIKEYEFEGAGKYLTLGLFSPKLQMARARMMNPLTYTQASPYVRKQYLKGMLAVGSAWSTLASLAWGAGAEVSLDPDSSDFGKIKIGNTRLDPAGGFQQYLVATHRLMSGRYVSSRTGEEFTLGQGYQARTGKSVMEQFTTNKFHPVIKFAYDLANASEHQPFSIGDRTAQMFVPLIVQDLLELAANDPELIPIAMPPVMFGMGTQTYEPGSNIEDDPSRVLGSIGQLTDIPLQDYDVKYTGGGFPGLMRDIGM